MRRIATILVILCFAFSLVSCKEGPIANSPTSTRSTITPTTAAPGETPLYLSIIWHQHQPLYYKDPVTSLYTKPWVRLHATKDYLDMVGMLENYPKIKVAFNLTPSLLAQIDDLAAGTQDYAQWLSRKATSALTDAEKTYILRRFYDANWQRVIPQFPRYQELLEKRGKTVTDESIQKALTSFSNQDFLDLVVLFNLAWMDPDFRSQPPLSVMVAKGRDYTEEEKALLLDRQLEILKQVVPQHKKLQDQGQIEITTTPYAHPILPLIYDSNLAKVAMPGEKLPARFSYPLDAVAQISKGVASYQAHFGRLPRGMWPAEGAVAQEIVNLVYDAGIQWIASDEEVLAKSLGLDSFSRDGTDLVLEPEKLYQPYTVYHKDHQVSTQFRDKVLSDLIGFRYSGTPGEEAAQDFINRLDAIRQSLALRDPGKPHLVSVILDGENAWEYYPNDGKDFLNALYRKLSDDAQIQTVTPAEYLKQFPPEKSIKPLWSGSWINHDFSTWIGEEEENRAWECLLQTRQAVDQTMADGSLDDKTKEQVMEAIYAAEGSDWFWWYGSDQDSGDDATFDFTFRSYLRGIYQMLGRPVPDFVYVPIGAQAFAKPDREPSGLVTPSIDGLQQEGEWTAAGRFQLTSSQLLKSLDYGLDKQALSLAVEFAKPISELPADLSLSVYFGVPNAKASIPFSRNGATGNQRNYLGFYASYEFRLQRTVEGWVNTLSLADANGYWTAQSKETQWQSKDQTAELRIPLEWLASPQNPQGGELAALQTGDTISMRVVLSSQGKDLETDPPGPFRLILPESGTSQTVLTVEDPLGDDTGPGSYVYPTDPAFTPGCFDLQHFTVAQDAENVIFIVGFANEIGNPWNSPIGLSLQTIDIYIHQPERSWAGATLLLPGRGARLSKEEAWHYAVWVEGWSQGLYRVDDAGLPQKTDVPLKVVVDAAGRTVSIRVPKSALGDNPAGWGYLCAICSQEGYPAPGVWRVREVKKTAEQWRFGGGINGWSDPGILDLAWAQGELPSQAEMLSGFISVEETNVSKIPEESFAKVLLLFP